MKAIVKFRKLNLEEEYRIGDFHKLSKSKKLWPVRSQVGGLAGESRHLESGREFYRVDMPLGVGAEIVK